MGLPSGPDGNPRSLSQQQKRDSHQLQSAAAPSCVRIVHRSQEIEEARSGLPVLAMEQEIMEAVLENDVVVLCGETGSGKTTQVPQFLLEAGFGSPNFPERAGKIGITQPRRVAAVASAQRVSYELGTSLGPLVGYQVRYDKRVAESTPIKFMTDGILMREVQSDFLLASYSVIIIDEAHERSLNTDLLIGLLSRIVPLRRKMADAGEGTALKLVIMSATLRTEDFIGNKRLFPKAPPLVHVPARQYPVTVHFSRRTELDDYVGTAFKKTCQIHRQLPPGGILVFMTGQREVEHLCARLRRAFPPPSKPPGPQGKDPKRGSGGSGEVDTRPVTGSTPGAASHPQNRTAASPEKCPAASPQGPSRAPGEKPGKVRAGEEEERAEKSGVGEEVEEEEYVEVYGGDAAEQAADVAHLGNNEEDDWGDSDDFEDDELLEEEEEVVVLGGDGFSPEDIAAAERRFEEVLGVSLAGIRSTNGASCSKGHDAITGEDNGNDGAGQDDGGNAGGPSGPGPVHVLPLYAMLHKAAQEKVFSAPPAGARLIVVATNVAETSLTIPGVRYVVDAGRSKQKLLEAGGAMVRYDVRWISKASAEQRAGRAGRTGPGHCYRLYSSAVYNDTFRQHAPPEILVTPLEGVLLSMRAMGIDKVINFPYPSPPEREALRAAEQCLADLGALDAPGGTLTLRGRAMAGLPIDVHHSRMLLQAFEDAAKGGPLLGDLPAYAVALAAALSAESPYVHMDSRGAYEGETEAEAKARRSAAAVAQDALRHPLSDSLSAMTAFLAWQQGGSSDAFAWANFLHSRNLREMAALREQLTRLLPDTGTANPSGPKGRDHILIRQLEPSPSPVVSDALRRALTAGWADQVAQRVKAGDAVAAAAQEGTPDRKAVRYRACNVESPVFLHPRSRLARVAPAFVVYTELVKGSKRPYMAGVTEIEAEWLHDVAAPLCTVSDPMPEYPARYMPGRDAVMCRRQVQYGRYSLQLPHVIVLHPDPEERVAAFAAALLDGSAVPSLAGLKSELVMPASAARRVASRAQKRVGELLAALAGRSVDSRASLAAAWQAHPTFLHRELLAWLSPAGAQMLQALWPRLLQEMARAGKSANRADGSGKTAKRRARDVCAGKGEQCVDGGKKKKKKKKKSRLS
eukprot:jgi/Botrbrau1/5953/Bobra.0366s0123.1